MAAPCWPHLPSSPCCLLSRLPSCGVGACAALNYTHFIKVISTVVQSKMKHPSDTGAEMLQAFVEFETTCR